MDVEIIVFRSGVFVTTSKTEEGWGSSLSIVSDYTLDNRDSIPGRDEGFFL
jgi:hypothetical protein